MIETQVFLDPLHGLKLPKGTPGQLHSETSLGFGYLYYGLSRIINPKCVVCIGSKWGFSPALFALGQKHAQGDGRVYFIDAGYEQNRDDLNKSWGGAGIWKNSGGQPFVDLDLNNVEMIVARTSDVSWDKDIDILLIDGDHTYEGCKYDYEKFGPYASYILFHDTSYLEDTRRIQYDGSILPPLKNERSQYQFGVRKLVSEIEAPKFEIPIFSGLTLIDNREAKKNKRPL